MKAQERIQWSVSLRKVQKLIVCRGYASEESLNCCGAIGFRVGQTLLARCAPSPSDVHDSEGPRSPGRDAQGRTRSYYTRHGNSRGSGRTSRRQSQSSSTSMRSPQVWDSERAADFGGIWTDRLLLGDHLQPSRTALLLPKVPAVMEGDSISRAAHTLRHVHADDVLLVTTTSALPLGVVRLHQGDLPPELDVPLTRLQATPLVPVRTALDLFGRAVMDTADAKAFFSMWVGVGGEDGVACPRGPRSLLSADEGAFTKDLLLPLTAFAAALWTANPSACATYLEKATANANTLTPQSSNKRLWRTMQASMLSTRDTALLEAHFSGKTLDARLSAQQQTYLAETLLRRLEDEDSCDSRPTPNSTLPHT